MTLALIRAALRRHPLSVVCSVLVALCSASLSGISVPLAMVLWIAASLLSVSLWYAFELSVLARRACRPANRLERERLHGLCTSGARLLVSDGAEPWLWRGLRSVVVSRALLDLLDDPALLGLLTQAAQPIWAASLAGELLVWLAILPLVGVWLISGWLALLGRLLAVLVGWSLVLPLLLWPQGFVRSVGGLFGAVIVALVGALLLSSGLAGLGLGLLLSWALVPGMRALLVWEWRRTEAVADQQVIEAGLGAELFDALETLQWVDAPSRLTGLLGLLFRPGVPLSTRAERVWRSVAQA